MEFHTKSRSFCFTINNPTHYDLADTWELYDQYGKYMITGFEYGDTGVLHIQGFIQCKNPQFFNTIRGVIVRAHVERAKASVLKNVEYCSKDRIYVEFGDKPLQGKASWDKIQDAMSNPKDNIHLYNQYRKSYIDIMAREEPEKRERVLYRFPYVDRYFLMSYITEKYGYRMCLSYDMYDGEPVVIHDCRNEYEIDPYFDNWAHGYPPKIKFGYQYMRLDPEVIILLVDEEHIAKKLKSLPEYSIVDDQTNETNNDASEKEDASVE